MKLNQLRNLVAVAEAGSVRQASRNINISQSAVTKTIKQLEDDLGVELLHRASHGVVPTAAGEALILRARIIEAELREARNDVETAQGGLSGDIRVSTSPSAATGILPQAVVNFRRSRPNVKIQIEEAVYPDQLGDLRSGHLDFAVCLIPERPSDEGLHCEVLVKDRLTPAVRFGHPLTAKRGLELHDLLNREWVIYRRGRVGHDIFQHTFTINSIEPPTRVVYCASFLCALKLIESGDFLTLVPNHLFRGQTNLAGIVPIILRTPMPAWNVAVITRGKHTLSPVCAAFLAELRRVAGALS